MADERPAAQAARVTVELGRRYRGAAGAGVQRFTGPLPENRGLLAGLTPPVPQS